MFSNNFKWVFLIILLVIFGVLATFDPFNWWGTYDVDQAMVATIVPRKDNAIKQLPQGANYFVTTGSTLGWEARKVGGFHTGMLAVADGVAVISGNAIIGAEVVFDMNDIIVSDIPANDPTNATLVEDLKGFFDVATHPTAVFFLTSYTSGQAEGDLTLNGVTNAINFPAQVTISDAMLTIKADFYIQRSQWNLTKWNGMVQEELGVSFDFTAYAEGSTILTDTIASGGIASGVVSEDITTGDIASGDIITEPAKTVLTEEDIMEAILN